MKRLLSVLSPMVTTAGILALSGTVLAQSPSQSHRAASARAHEIMSSAPCPLPRVTKDKITEEQARDLAQAFADKNMSGFKVVRPLGYGGGYTTMCYQTSPMVASVQPSSAATGNRNADRDTIGNRRTEGSTTVGRDTDQPNQSRLNNDPATANANRNVGSAAAVRGSDQQIITASSARPLILYSVEYSVDVKNAAGQTRNLCVDQFGTVSEFCNDIGFAGATGPAGPIGPAGPMGAQGPAGAAGSQAQASAATQWSSFKDFSFSFDQSAIRSNETSHVTDIAAYMKQNPTAQVGIDGHTDPRGTDAYNQSLSERRVNTIKEALVNAGVVDGRIKAGAFGESRPKCNESTEACWQIDRRVEVLIGNAQTASR